MKRESLLMSKVQTPRITAPILLVSLDPQTLQSRLESPAREVIVVTSGQEALNRLIQAEHEFALIIVDDSIHDMAMSELTKQIRNIYKYTETYLLFILSQTVDESILLREQSFGMVDYLSRPFAPAAFINKVELFCRLYHAERQASHYRVKSRQEMAERIRLEAQLARYKNHFETQVKARTLELAQNNQALQQAESRYRDIFENSVEGIFQTTPKGQYIQVNPALVRIYGYDSPEDLMTTLNDIEQQLYVSRQRRAEFIEILENQDSVVDFESQIYRKDGSIIWIKENARAVRDEQHKLLYYEGMVEDITARKQAEAELLRVNRASSRFVPHQLLRLLGKASITELKLNDCVHKKMSIVFVDIRSFTSLSESMSPLDNFRFINAFLSQMGPLIRQHHGFIDKYLGDGIMALFEQPTDAVKAGLDMLYQLRVYNRKRHQNSRPMLTIGIGINTGEVMLGTVGYDQRLEGTVIGDAVNLAARIEQLTKQYQTPLLIGDDTFRELEAEQQTFSRCVGRVRIKGKSQEVVIYEVFASDLPEIRQAKLATKQIFETAWLLYQQGHRDQAYKLFTSCLHQNPHDVVTQTYLKLCCDEFDESVV